MERCIVLNGDYTFLNTINWHGQLMLQNLETITIQQKLEIYKTQARELESMLGLDSGMLEKNTGEEMKDSFSGHLPEMERKIHNLENGNLEEKAKAKQMREINKAIKNRKF